MTTTDRRPPPQTMTRITQRILPLADMTLADIPPSIGLFPLGNTILLPKGQLPLTVFEPRYRAMLEDCLARHRMLGIIQPAPQARPGEEKPPLAEIGTLGRVTSFMEQENGQFFITLTGVCRFCLLRENLTAQGWREGHINATPFSHDLLENPAITLDHDELATLLKDYAARHGVSINWESLKKLEDTTLLTMLPMLLPFPAALKQELLECPNLTDRATLLLEILAC